MRIHIRVQTRARADVVGGRYGNDEPPILIVRVRAAPHDGRANAACVRALAEALGLPRQAVRIAAGERSKSKIVEVRGADPARIDRLLGTAPPKP